MKLPNDSDLERLRSNLRALPDWVRSAERLLEVLWFLAHERPTSDAEKVSVRRLSWYLDENGVIEAKTLLRDLAKNLNHLSGEIERTSRGIVNLLSTGPSEDVTLRGTLLGDDFGNGAQSELNRLLRARKRRMTRGEFTPPRDYEQPKVAGEQ